VKQHVTCDIPEDGRISLKRAVLITTQGLEVGHRGDNHVPIETFTKVAVIGVKGND
jgi:hypothetical protein